MRDAFAFIPCLSQCGKNELLVWPSRLSSTLQQPLCGTRLGLSSVEARSSRPHGGVRVTVHVAKHSISNCSQRSQIRSFVQCLLNENTHGTGLEDLGTEVWMIPKIPLTIFASDMESCGKSSSPCQLPCATTDSGTQNVFSTPRHDPSACPLMHLSIKRLNHTSGPSISR